MGLFSAPLRATANALGLAWWARVDTRQPDVTYWFGPYVRRHTLECKLPAFLAVARRGAEKRPIRKLMRRY
ncbi:MAG: DUF1816 domain-containing protein, partial [Synechococcaceae bacterium WB6_3A_227]|nr:DUF1816 domain-containing protein [Synechococcaceae bacterium WB6_3A_227]